MLLLYLTGPLYLPAMARFLDVSEPPVDADYVMVLGGDNDTRPFVGAALYNAGYTRKILIARIKLKPEAVQGLVVPQHEIMQRVLVARGVPAEAIEIIPGDATSTYDEARALDWFLENKDRPTVIVVTNTFHTRRARRIFLKVAGGRAGAIRFVSAPTEGFNENNWWRCEPGVSCYVNEFLKTPYYWLRY